MRLRIAVLFFCVLTAFAFSSKKITNDDIKKNADSTCAINALSSNAGVVRIDLFAHGLYRYCSGVLIAPGLVATAKHCFEKPFNQSTVRVVFDHAVIKPINVFLHKNIDIAVVQLDTSVDIHPLSLEPSQASFKADMVYLVGFGCMQQDRLQHYGYVIDDDDYMEIYGCVCLGDSGGAVIDVNSGKVIALMIATSRDQLGQIGYADKIDSSILLEYKNATVFKRKHL